MFDVIHARRPVLILNIASQQQGDLTSLRNVVSHVSDVIHDQLSAKEDFNIIWYGVVSLPSVVSLEPLALMQSLVQCRFD